jgi:hypothetical protein
MSELREKLIRDVAGAVRNPKWGEQTVWDDARIAVDTVLEFLAREAGDVETDLSDDGGRTMITLADWLRAMAKEPRNEQT